MGAPADGRFADRIPTGPSTRVKSHHPFERLDPGSVLGSDGHSLATEYRMFTTIGVKMSAATNSIYDTDSDGRS
jgi:hypothetical protein